jgi:hypothetical protein
VIDTGIWPEHPSFADTGYGPPPAGWSGECQAGEQWSQQHCNNKLIGARYFEKGFGHFGGVLAGDYQSARDSDGHGSHTASTAGGNAGVPAEMFGRSYGTISGMAPRARIAAYKACWPGGCATTDLVAAIDAAVGDGVDVINFSIGDGNPTSSTRTTWRSSSRVTPASSSLPPPATTDRERARSTTAGPG